MLLYLQTFGKLLIIQGSRLAPEETISRYLYKRDDYFSRSIIVETERETGRELGNIFLGSSCSCEGINAASEKSGGVGRAQRETSHRKYPQHMLRRLPVM